MNTDAQNPEFHARVHEGHIANFRRKITSAENRPTLEQICRTVDAAAAKNMISESDRDALRREADLRREGLRA